MIIVHKTIKYMSQMSSDRGNIPKSWSLNTMVKSVFRPEAVLTLFRRMRTKGIAKLMGKCMPIEESLPCDGHRCRRSE